MNQTCHHDPKYTPVKGVWCRRCGARFRMVPHWCRHCETETVTELDAEGRCYLCAMPEPPDDGTTELPVYQPPKGAVGGE